MIAFEQILVIRLGGEQESMCRGVKACCYVVSNCVSSSYDDEHLHPSGRRGLMLGLMRGRSAGDTIALPLPLPLARLVVDRDERPFAFLSFSRPEGVLAEAGDGIILGLSSGRADKGVLRGPSFGVFLAVLTVRGGPRALPSFRITVGERCVACVDAASGSSSSSSEIWPIALTVGVASREEVSGDDIW